MKTKYWNYIAVVRNVFKKESKNNLNKMTTYKSMID